MEDSDTVVIAPVAGGNALLQIWDIEFIKKYHPKLRRINPQSFSQ